MKNYSNSFELLKWNECQSEKWKRWSISKMRTKWKKNTQILIVQYNETKEKRWHFQTVFFAVGEFIIERTKDRKKKEAD